MPDAEFPLNNYLLRLFTDVTTPCDLYYPGNLYRKKEAPVQGEIHPCQVHFVFELIVKLVDATAMYALYRHAQR